MRRQRQQPPIPDAILERLAEKGSTVSTDDFISTKFIEDCVRENKYLDVASYSVARGTIARRDSDKSFSSDDSMSPANTIIRTLSRDCKGRNKYTKEEDIAMINFLVTERRYNDATGIKVWKDMERLKVTAHSAESMNTRYRKVILPNIQKYKYDISARWVSLLTGNTDKEKEPEFSVEALFKPKRTHRQSPMKKPVNHSAWKKSENHSPSKKTERQSPRKKSDNTLPSTMSNPGEKESKTVPPDFTLVASDHIASKNQESTDKIPSKKKPLYFHSQDSFHDENVVSKQNAHSIESDISVHEKVNDSIDSRQVAGLEKVDDLHGSISERRLRKRKINDQDVDKHDQKNMHSPITADQKIFHKNESDKSECERPLRSATKSSGNVNENAQSKNKGSPQKQKNKNTEETSQKIGSQSLLGSSNSLYEVSSTQSGENLINLDSTDPRNRLRSRQLKSNENQKSDTIGSKTSTDNDNDHNECQIKKSKSPTKHNNKKDKQRSRHSSEKDNAGKTTDNVEDGHVDTDVDYDSFDNMLLGHAQQSPRKRPHVTSNSDNESDQKKTRRWKDSSIKPTQKDSNQRKARSGDSPAKSTKSKGSPQKSPHKTIETPNKTCTGPLYEDTKNIETTSEKEQNVNGFLLSYPRKSIQTLTVTVSVLIKKLNCHKVCSADSTTKTADSVVNDVYSFQSDSSEDEAVTECRRIFRGTARKFGLPSEYVRQLLYRNNGIVPRMIAWIKCGPYSPWPPAWTEYDDQVLRGGEEIDRLLVKFGDTDVKDRLEWLGINFEETEQL